MSTYTLPFGRDLAYLQNFGKHAFHLRECARVLNDFGLRLSHEYVGPRTLWRSSWHPFVTR